MLQVIMIARLHAMYQGSRTMLIFLVIIFLAINIACAVLTAIALKYVGLGKFYLLSDLQNTAHWTNTRGADTLWHPYVQLFL
jgi:hypothetical protein